MTDLEGCTERYQALLNIQEYLWVGLVCQSLLHAFADT